MPTCMRCGKCCALLHLLPLPTVEADDVARWQRQKRKDTPCRVGEARGPNGTVHEVRLSPRVDGGGSGVGEDGHCPWLRHTRDGLTACAIHETRPARCRDYPAGCEQARRIGCMALP